MNCLSLQSDSDNLRERVNLGPCQNTRLILKIKLSLGALNVDDRIMLKWDGKM
jgi:hypothetical protein